MSELTEIRNHEEIDSIKTKRHKGCLNHPFYDWITLLSTLFVPLVVGILTIVLPLQQQNLSNRQNENSQTIAVHNRLKDMEILHDQQKQTILNTYEQDLCNLIFKYSSINNYNDTNNDGIDDDNDDERVSLVIRTKTLYALRQLDPVRKILLIQLLIDSGIKNRINLSHLDLSSLTFPPGSFYNQLNFVNIIAKNLSFKRIHLYRSNFSYSILDGSSFQQSNCSYADFSYASLQRTDWTNTDVTQVVFNYTNLLGAKITSQQLATVQSLKGATLPNGTIVAI
ncbi:unnamed protein product [Rotaria sordida]|uniref:Pentapeptide repeat-containing protein n=1 Tax=Rotaria sordida TaxID=392033 RepID=A0A818J4H1_9BILA|nr:unnamed protein product [Rotaria sordida]CAF0758111.1 unnamed protein product [Rotaria sordida]CAF0822719.1 unnamed protein product [Rotaria sordida]CAF0973682.1 unnamed protein product [Rotaria sordida]CAF3535091.1 unnamed protein product [Rotaria sordida]